MSFSDDMHATHQQLSALKTGSVQLINRQHGLKDPGKALVLVHGPVPFGQLRTPDPELVECSGREVLVPRHLHHIEQ